jgi:RNA polymerase sigma-70 factor (ECF subfamily)
MVLTVEGADLPTHEAGRTVMNADLRLRWSDLYRYVLKKVRDPAVSEDITQETFTRLFAYQRTRPVDNPPALGASIALNLVRDHFRGRRATAMLDDNLECSQPKPDEVMMHRQKLAILQKVIDRMPPLRREVFSRRRLHGESIADIARSLDLSPAAVEKHLVRGLSDLQSALDKRGERL